MEIIREGLRLHVNDKYIGNILLLVLFAFFALVIIQTSVILIAYVAFNIIEPGRSAKVRLGKFGVLFIAFMLAVAMSPTTTSPAPAVNIPTPVATPTPEPVATPTPEPVATPAPVVEEFKVVTIAELYAQSIPEMTKVEVSGRVIEGGSSGAAIRIEGANGKDIMIHLALDSKAVYEGDNVVIQGTFYGPNEYVTVLGGLRTIPLVRDGMVQ